MLSFRASIRLSCPPFTPLPASSLSHTLHQKRSPDPLLQGQHQVIALKTLPSSHPFPSPPPSHSPSCPKVSFLSPPAAPITHMRPPDPQLQGQHQVVALVTLANGLAHLQPSLDAIGHSLGWPRPVHEEEGGYAQQARHQL